MLQAGFRRCFLATLIAVGGGFVDLAPLPCAAGESTPKSSVDARLKALVDRHLKRNPDYMPGDILSRGDIEPIFDELIELGIRPADNSEELYDSILVDGQYVVQLFRTPQGRAFMRQVAKLPDAYDRLERLSWSPEGRTWLEQFVAAEDGPLLFERLLTDEGSTAVEKQLGNDRSARNFRRPTGHIYTEDQLLSRLQRAIVSQGKRNTQERATATPAEKPNSPRD